MELIRRKTGYGLRALLYMALDPDRENFTADELAKAAKTTTDFIHKILQSLRDAGIVSAKRGPGGGFRLARPAAEIPLLEVVKAVQGSLTINRCVLGIDICHRAADCPLRATWLAIQQEMERALADTALADVACSDVAAKLQRPSP